MGNIHQNFPTLFDTEIEESKSTEELEEGNNTSDGDFKQFGILPYVLKFCEVTHHTFNEAMEFDISTVFYIVSYEVMVLKKQEKEFKKMQRR